MAHLANKNFNKTKGSSATKTMLEANCELNEACGMYIRKRMKSNDVSDDSNTKKIDYMRNQNCTDRKMPASNHSQLLSAGNRKQFSSFVLFLSAIILVNLCPFHVEQDQIQLNHNHQQRQPFNGLVDPQSVREDVNGNMQKFPYHITNYNDWSTRSLMGFIETSFEFVKLMFSEPKHRLIGNRSTVNSRIILADARMLGKVAKVLYIKKKIKKLGKKLKKKTIAVPVFTAIPIYEHSYYPQPHVTHVSHGAIHHAAAASSYVPTYAQLATGATAMTSNAAAGQQLTTSSSNNQPMATYHRPPSRHQYHNNRSPMYHHHQSYHPAANQIINAYAPSPPLFVDEAGGLYGHYGNAYGRYDGGYQYW